LSEALALGSEHVSCYEVIYEEDTPLFAQLQAGRFEVDEDLACDMYDALLEDCAEAGIHQYEVANFARHPEGTPFEIPSRACLHNVNYWRGGTYHGLGPSAAGFVGGIRTRNWANTVLYCEQLEKGRRAIEWTEQLAPLSQAGETAAFGLRMNAGWPFDQFHQATGFDLRQEWAAELEGLAERGWSVIGPNGFRLTREGLRFADAAAGEFLRCSETAARRQ
jgi:oxygen-independent coproporphyrinogen-3 oxidase